MLVNSLAVAAGGALGSLARFWLAELFAAMDLVAFPWATLVTNVTGSLLIGVLAGWLSTRGEAGEPWRLFLGVGMLGGFTTFSAYSLETLRMVERGEWPMAIMYALGSVLAGLAAVAIGAEVARRIAV